MPKAKQKVRRKVALSPKPHLKKRIVLRHRKAIPTLDARCRALVDCMDLAAWMGDKEERTIYANPKFCELMEYSLEEMLGRPSYDFCTPEDAKKIKEHNIKYRKKGISSSYEIELVAKSDKRIPALLHGTPLPDGGTVGILRDLRELKKKEAERKIVENELKSSKKLFDDLVEGSPVAMLAVNMDHKVIYWNKETEKLTGIKASEMLGTSNHWKSFYKKKRRMIVDFVIDGLSNKEILKHYEKIDAVEIEKITKERSFIGSFCFTNAHGQKKWIRFMVRPLRDANNHLVGGVVINEDITESKRMSESLTNRMRELQVLYQVNAHIRMVTPLKRVLKDIAKDIVLACDEVKPARARIVFDNKTYTNLRKGEKFLSKIEEPLKAFGRKRGSVELGYVEKISNKDSFLMKQEKKVLHIVARTIGKHVQSREIMKRYQKLVNKFVVGVFIVQDDIFQYINPKFTRLFKLQEKEIIGLRYSDLISECACYTKIKKNKKLNSARCTGKGKLKDGTCIDLEVYTQRIDYYGRPAILGTVKDITKLKEAEDRQRHFNEELQSKVAERTRDLQKANRRLRSLNELKDEFIAVTSHELRSPLTAIRGYLSFLVDEGIFNEIPESAKDYLMRVYDNAEVLNNLVNNILDVSRLEMDRFELHQTPNDIVGLIQNVIENLKFQANEKGLKVHFLNRLKKERFILKFDSIRIRQVLRNILDNAIKYSPQGKNIWVELEIKGIGLQISITDQGIGVPKSQIFEIFDKFKQAKNTQTRLKGGAGLGLFIAKKIIELHGGMIWAESEIRKGTSFKIQLPLD